MEAAGPADRQLDVHRSTLSSSVLEVEQYAADGIVALREGRFREAETLFLKALHPVLDLSVQAAIVNASQLPPARARAECARIVALEQQQKGGVNYLLAIALLRQHRAGEAADPLRTAAAQTVGWMCVRVALPPCQ